MQYSCYACGTAAPRSICASCAAFLNRTLKSFEDEELREREETARIVARLRVAD